jgi:hypothetical protein
VSGVTPNELELIRVEREKFMQDQVIIKRREFLGDTENEYVPIDDELYPVTITPGYGLWRTVADRFQGITAFTVVLPWDTDVQAGDILVQGVRVFEVRDIRSPSTFLTAKLCLCDQTTGD